MRQLGSKWLRKKALVTDPLYLCQFDDLSATIDDMVRIELI